MCNYFVIINHLMTLKMYFSNNHFELKQFLKFFSYLKKVFSPFQQMWLIWTFLQFFIWYTWRVHLCVFVNGNYIKGLHNRPAKLLESFLIKIFDSDSIFSTFVYNRVRFDYNYFIKDINQLGISLTNLLKHQ
jgi:hypothetical protein